MKHLILALVSICAIQLYGQSSMFDICPLKVGEAVPSVALLDAAGHEVSMLDLVSDEPSVIIFYRGAWCPYCTKHLAELQEIKEVIEELGFEVFGVTVDRPNKLEKSQEETDDIITVYSDSKLTAIKAFGLNWHVEQEQYDMYKEKYDLDLEKWSGEVHHELPVPAVFVVKEGKIVFQYVNPNYNTRLSPETLLAVLNTL